MTPDSERSVLVRALRGAPWTVVIAFLFWPGAHGETELAARTGYNRRTVRGALIELEALGFVQRHGRYEAWALTSTCRQMILGESEGGNLPLSSSSSSNEHEICGTETDPETTTTGEGQKLPLEIPDGTDGAYGLLLRLGCSPQVAITAIDACLAAGWEPDEVCGETEAWFDYCRSPLGRGIRSPGFLVARRLREGVTAPEVPGESSVERAERETRRYLEEQWSRIVRN